MASPFIDDPVELGARTVRGSLWRQRGFKDRADPLAFPDDILHERYRFSSEGGICYICSLVEPSVRNATGRSCALTVGQTVCVALRFFATGTYMHLVGDAENVSKNTVCRAVHKVVLALTERLNMFVVFPSHVSTLTVKEAFYQLAGSVIPQDYGCNRLHPLPNKGPLGENEGDYVNRKSFHSINVQMTCDHQLLVTNVEARWPGSVHDSRIFRESLLGHQLEQGLFDGLLVGDRGYPCARNLMTPYPDPATPSQSRFNVALGKCRVRIEMTFGVIKSRFNCLRGLRVRPERACKIIAACVVLHNIAIIRKERAPHVPLVAPDEVDPVTVDHPTGAAIRQAITVQFFS
uniref:Putative nuclease HARBI1 n=1 Tax=Myripristis murdjan TaxID=586833 RepID=A0A668A926_9TELE